MNNEISHIISAFPMVVFYRGDYKAAPTDTIIAIIESNEKLAKRKVQLKKLMFLSVEAIQNIQRYSAHSDQHSDSSLVLCDGKTYQVLTRNLVLKAKTHELKERLLVLDSKNKEGLEELYMNALLSEEKTEKGSGLGLIEIARKSDHNFTYRINDVDEKYSLFELGFAFPVNKEEEIHTDLNASSNLHQKLYSTFCVGKSSFLFSGDFSNNFLMAVLELLLSKSSESELNTNKKIHHILIELIQNIKRHAQSKDDSAKGKLLLQWANDALLISTENVGTKDNLQKFSEKIVTLNGLNKQGLETKSKEILMDLDATNGLGLVDIASLIYPERISFEIYPREEGFSEICMNLKINHA